MSNPDAELMRESAGDDRLELIISSYKRLTGRDLIENSGNTHQALWQSARIVLAHATQEDPIFFYANSACLNLFEASACEFVKTPSRFSAEPMERAERDRLFLRVKEDNYIDDYEGVRVTFPKGEKGLQKRFNIEQATVWNLIDEQGDIHGQAATFSNWTWLDN